MSTFGQSLDDIAILSREGLSEQSLIDHCRDSKAGAICVFSGCTRDTFQDRIVDRLEYEAYSDMAIKSLRNIIAQARQLTKSGAFSAASPTSTIGLAAQPAGTPSIELIRVAVAHRLGIVPPAETSIVVAVSCSHRRESFAACEWILEAVKAKAEIWKNEVYADGSTWKANV